MADNSTLPATGEVIASDDVTTLNGAGSSGVKVQRIKNGWGADNTYVDVSGTKPLPVSFSGDRIQVSRSVISCMRTPGMAGTAGQALLSLSATNECVIHSLTVTLYATVVKAVTVAPPLIRLYSSTRVGTPPAMINGQAARIYTFEGTFGSTALMNSGSDGSSASGGALAPGVSNTNTPILAAFAPRLITAVGLDLPPLVELIPRTLNGRGLVVHAGDCFYVQLDYTLATQNPVTDMWLAAMDVSEFTVA